MNSGLRQLLLLSALLLPYSLSASVSIEFQFGGVNAPPGSVGVIVADVNGDGFVAPGDSPGVPLTQGAVLGADDVIVAVLSNADWPEWSGRRGFADHLAVIAYEALGVAEGQDLILYIFPERSSGDPLRSDEPHLEYLESDLSGVSTNSTMGFQLPADGGAYLLSVISQDIGGEADLASLDIGRFPLPGQFGDWERTLGVGERHTYYFEMEAAGFLAIAAEGGDGLTAEIYKGSQLVATGSGGFPFWFEGNLDNGWHTLVIRKVGGGPVAADYGVRISSAWVRKVRPDIAIGRTLGTLQASGVVFAPGADVRLISRKARRVRGFASVANRGDRPESLAVSGSRRKRFFRVAYNAPTGNVTAAVTSGRYRTPTLAATTPATILRATVTPDKRRLVRKSDPRRRTLRKSYSTLLVARSTRQPELYDGGWLRVFTR